MDEPKPLARAHGLVTELVGSEMLVYDKTSNVASQLDEIAAWVMRACDGTRTVGSLATGLSEECDKAADQEVVLMALDRLCEAGLIESGYEARDDSALSRRRFFHRAGMVGAGAVSAPVVFSLVVPSAAAAGSGSSGGGEPTPAVDTDPATHIGPTSATLVGGVNGHDEETTYYFEYGTNTRSYKSTSPKQELNPGGVHVSVTITGLTPGTTYYFRLVVKNSGGTVYGRFLTFTTTKR